MRIFRIALAQMNPTVGDLSGNVRKIQRWIREAKQAKAELVAFPELALTGYPPEDLLLKQKFLDESVKAMDEVTKAARGITVVVGYVRQGLEPPKGAVSPFVVSAGRLALYNAAAILANGRMVTSYAKRCLPNYGVFDESRYFHPGQDLSIVLLNGTWVGINICEDIWHPDGPIKAQAFAGAEVIVNINASPFQVGKSRFREQMLGTRARDHGVIVTYTNMVGGQDELVFDGNSVMIDQQGEVILRGKAFEEQLVVADLNVTAVSRTHLTPGRKKQSSGRIRESVQRIEISSRVQSMKRPALTVDLPSPPDSLAEIYQALVLGVRDYVRKNGFRQVVIGLSGGIDSTLTAAIAYDALGGTNVLGVFMPSPYTSLESKQDVADLCKRLGIKVITLGISGIFKKYLEVLSPQFKGQAPDLTEENIQARIRGNLLMGLSNKYGHLVLTTGNKSEMSVGYATLYGDMAGGFAVIRDVPKMLVYDLSRFRNTLDHTPVIPKRVLEKAPSAELRPEQKDEDSLPPYHILDPILQAYVEEDRSLEEIVAMGFAVGTVRKVIRLVDRSEYKRRQGPIGIKITHRAFGKDRRMPITNRYKN